MSDSLQPGYHEYVDDYTGPEWDDVPEETKALWREKRAHLTTQVWFICTIGIVWALAYFHPFW